MRELLLDVYARMLDRYGRLDWWPANSPFEVMVGAILVQNTSWQNAAKAIASLRDAGALSPRAIRETPEDELAALIYSSGYYRSKAKKMKAFVAWLGERNDDIEALRAAEPEALRKELLGIHGVGDETADDILLYALDHPIFVVDAYTRRLLFRLGLSPERGAYAEYQRVFMENLPPDAALFNEYHALIVRHGSSVCKKKPACGECCLLDLCPIGQAATKQAVAPR